MIGRFFLVVLGGALAASAAPARAELVLSEVIVELQPGVAPHRDIEIWNNSPERVYLVAEPREIVDPGQPAEAVRRDPDPEKLGLLVSPARAIFEPGQRKLLRIASLAGSPPRERVYRVTVKPVAGAVTSEQSGLKLLLGYDVLVLVRPAAATPAISVTRTGGKLVLRNDGNSSVEMFDGKQCNAAGAACTSLPAKRLYAGAQWRIDLPSAGPVDYSVRSSTGTAQRRF
jgi:P pilus assembly chaperone PapD